MSTTVTFASGIKTPARDENLGQNAGVWPPTSRTLYVDSRGRKSLPMCSSRIQQDIPLVQIERYFLQAPALGHDRSRATAALGGGGGSRTTSSRQWVRRVKTSRIIRIAAGRGPVTRGLNDQSSSNSPGERAGAHRASFARPRTVAPHPGEHQRDRIGFLHRGDGLPQRETLACGRPHRTLGRFGSAGGRAPVSQGTGLSRDSVAVDFACEHAFEEGGCRGREGCVAYDGRESLTFNGVPGNVVEVATTTTLPLEEGAV